MGVAERKTTKVKAMKFECVKRRTKEVCHYFFKKMLIKLQLLLLMDEVDTMDFRPITW